MRTRNRGQRISVVSALGIRNPSKFRRRSSLSLTTSPFRGRTMRRGVGRSARSCGRISRGGTRGRIWRGIRGKRSTRLFTPQFTEREMINSEEKLKKGDSSSPSGEIFEPLRKGTRILRGRISSRGRSLCRYRGRYSGNSVECLKRARLENQHSPKEHLSEYRSRRGSRSGKRCISRFATPLRLTDLNETSDTDGIHITEISIDRPVAVVAMQPKRKRGRPPLSSVSIRNFDVKSPTTDTNVKPIVEFEKEIKPTPLHRVKPEGCYEDENLDMLACADYIRINPSYCTESLRFGAVDDVLQEILDDVNKNGYVPKVNKLAKVSQDECIPLESDLKMQFTVPIIANIFDDIWRATTSLLRPDNKDLYLALNGLVRPGVCEIWRRRREHQSKQLNRSSMGRLRPNPRPRRYSDMVLPRNDTSRSRVAGGNSLSEKLRKQSARAAALSAARLTAAKKLILAKSHHNVVGSPPFVTCRPQLSTEPIISPPQQSLTTRSVRPRKAAKISVPFPVTTRRRRRPDISHHIDWKFCYNTSQKPEQPCTSPGELPINARRKSGVSVMEVTNPDLQTSKIQSPKASETASTVVALNEQPSENILSDTPNIVECSSDIVKEDPDSEAAKLLSRFSCESTSTEPRKRRHAITVQRKRPVDRSLNIMERNDPSFWMERPVADVNSGSSSPRSSLTDVYGRAFRGSSWYQQRMAKANGNMPSSKNAASTEPGESSGVKLKPSKPTSHGERNIYTALSRRSKNISPPSSLTPHSIRVPRRSDRCQLTLLDRLVLGFNCSVSSADNYIHVRRLHAKDLPILIQRMNGTGYSIKHLALRPGTSEDAEYYVVLTFSSTGEPSQRPSQTNSYRRRPLNDDRESESQMYASNERYIRRRLKKHRSEIPFDQRVKNSLAPSSPSRLVSHSFSNSGNTEQRGYHSDSELISHPRLREPSSYCAHSDSEVISIYRRVGASEDALGVDDKRDCSIPSTASTSKLHPESNTHPLLAHQTLKMAPSLKPIAKAVDGDYSVSDSESGKILPDVTTRSVQLNSKHTPTCHLNMGPFRRHSPRKVIRKVYTGNVTIPKILNRKRPISSIGNTSVQSYVGLNNKPIGSAPAGGTMNNLYSNECTPQASRLYDDASHEKPSVVFSHQTQPAFSPMSYRHYQQATVDIKDIPAPQTDTTLVAPSVFPDKCSDGCFQITNTGPYESAGITPTHPVLPCTSMAETTATETTTVVAEHVRENAACEPQIVERFEKEYSENNASIKAEHADVAATSLSCQQPVGEEPAEPLTDTGPAPTRCAVSSSHQAAQPVPTTAPTEDVEPCQQKQPSAGQEQASDESYTPARSLSASQLLKLKRRHDDCGRSPPHILSSGDTHAGHLTTVCQPVSSPSLDPLITASTSSQTKSVDSINFNCLRQSAEKPPASFGANRLQFQHFQSDIGACSNPAHLAEAFPTPLQKTATSSSGSTAETVVGEPVGQRHNDEDDSEDFELKTTVIKADGQNDNRPEGGEDGAAPTVTAFKARTQTMFVDAPVGNSGTVLIASTVASPSIANCVSLASSAYPSVDLDAPSLPSIAHHHQATSAFLARFQTPTGPVSVRPIASRFNYNLHHQVASPAAGGLVTPQQGLSFVCPLVAQKHSPSGELLTASQVITRVVVQSPPSTSKLCGLETSGIGSLSGRPFIHCGPVDSVHAGDCITTPLSTVDALPRVLCSPAVHPSAGTALAGVPVSAAVAATAAVGGVGPMRRTIVHKYHSFRKILPKSSSEHPGFPVGPVGPATALTRLNSSTGLAVSGSCGAAPLAVHGNICLLQANSMQNLETMTEPGFGIDLVSSTSSNQSSVADASREAGGSAATPGSIGHLFEHHVLPCYPSATGGHAPRPQLLKSLLESVDAAREAGGVHSSSSSVTPMTTTITAVVVDPSEPVSSQPRPTGISSGTVAWNQPAHQSRGTWQLGKRAVSNSNISTSGGSLGRQSSGGPVVSLGSNSSEAGGQVFVPRTLATGSHSVLASAASSAPLLPPATSPVLRFTPGSASRLQQLQQHYQKQQQQQQQQSAVAGASCPNE